MAEERDITYHNKDVTSKVITEKFPKVSLSVYGLDTPRIKQLLPTNLPRIKVNELRLDNLFLFEDGTYAIIDYESTYEEKNKIKYLQYLTRVLQRYLGEPDLKLRMIVIYTADVKREDAKESLDVGDLKFTLEQAFLSELDSEPILENLTRKITMGEELNDEEKMQFIILPLSYEGLKKKREMIEVLFNLAKQLEDEETQIFLLAAMIAFADKVIDNKTANEMKGWIGMTKIAKLFEEEKKEAVKEAMEEKEREVQLDMARKMLADGEPEEKVFRYVPKVAAEVIKEYSEKQNKEGQ
ncbi:MAG: hypothetical protein PHN80_00255 [Hespellia sp.]|nr:hypothetical protein [Hespellia sp.]